MPRPAPLLALPALAALTLAAAPQTQHTVPVQLTEYHIAMPDTVQQGQVVFAVTNAGTTEHQLAVRGHRGLRSTRRIKPGETVTLPMRLIVGEYTAYCSVREHDQSHRALGMEHAVRVVW
jgi:hypothetical protein